MGVTRVSKPVPSRPARRLMKIYSRNIVITAVRIVVILSNAFLRHGRTVGARTSYRRAEVLNGASLLWVIDTDERAYQVQDRALTCIEKRLSTGTYIL